jgi:hypothetical protein
LGSLALFLVVGIFSSGKADISACLTAVVVIHEMDIFLL